MSPRHSPEELARIDEVFGTALDLPAAERPQYLDAACGDDDVLRKAVEKLLGHSTGGTLVATGGGIAVVDASVEEPSLEGGRLGPYQLMNELGRGGMGVVYRARRADGEFEQEVALKVLRPGVSGSAAVQRFERERQILAGLGHPNIARLLDGGTAPDGTPYFAMELVDGERIDRYADIRQLSLDERLELFQAVGRAVHFAHQRLVIHRDLKPSNIVVAADGQVKLLDFGIAKLLEPIDAADAETREATRILTPEYASPEQLEGTLVTTSSDVYQLGLLLFQLVTGERATPDRTTRPSGETAQAPATRLPRRVFAALSPERRAEVAASRRTTPKRMRRELTGDLDRIVATALRPEPERRYGTAADLVEDLRKLREGRPISARPDSLGYRAGKFWQRHRFGVTTSVLLLFVLISYAVVVTVQGRRIANERNRAERVKDVALGLFGAADPRTALDPEITATELLDLGLERIDSELADEPDIQAETLERLGEVYVTLGKYERAEELQRRVVELRRRLDGERSESHAAALIVLGSTLLERDAPEAEELLRRSLALNRDLLAPDDPQLISNLTILAKALLGSDKNVEAESLLNEAIERLRRTGVDPSRLADALTALASVHGKAGQFEAAERSRREALALYQSLPEPDPTTVASAHNNLANALWDLERWSDGDAQMEESFRLMHQLYGDDHPDIATSLGNQASSFLWRGEPARAAEQYRKALEMRRRMLGERHVRVAQTTAQLAESLHAAGDLAAAEPLFRESEAIFGDSLPADHPSLARLARSQGMLLLDAGRPLEAEAELRRAKAIYEANDRPEWSARLDGLLAAAFRHQGQTARAEALLLESLPKIGENPNWQRRHLEELIAVYEATGRSEEAETYRRRLPPP